MDPLILVTLLLCLVPASSSSSSSSHSHYSFSHRKVFPLRIPQSTYSSETTNSSYAVIVDGGSTGTRIHVFHFNQSLNLIHIGDDFELYAKVTPGFSSYAKNPEGAAESLAPLIEKAESVVPGSSRANTPIIVGATAGLRELEGNASDLILEAVTDFLNNNSSFKVDAVAVLTGTQEGYYLWVTVNYLLGNLGKNYSETIGVIDLGGGSVQVAYAVPAATAANAPNSSYITDIYLSGTKYHIYVHSYLYHGKEASRAELLKLTGDSDNPCILAGYNGTYEYNDVNYTASALPGGSNFTECRNLILKFLDLNATCAYKNCTFDGIWNGGAGAGQKNIYLATSFYYLAIDAGFADSNQTISEVRPVDYKMTAELACKTSYKEGSTYFPLVESDVLPYLCLDLVYQYTLLVDGFGLDPREVVTVVDQIPYEDSYLDASWPLGSALEALSSTSNFESLMYVV